MNDVVRVEVRRTRSPIPWRRKIFQQLDAGTCVCPYSSDAQMRAKNLIQVFLLFMEIFAFASFAQPEQIPIEFKTGICV